jgi:hypothetical protein
MSEGFELPCFIVISLPNKTHPSTVNTPCQLNLFITLFVLDKNYPASLKWENEGNYHYQGTGEVKRRDPASGAGGD